MQPGNFLRQPVGCSQCGPTPGRGLSRAGGWDSQAAAESGCVLAGAGFVPSLHAAVAQAETGCTLPSWGVGCRESPAGQVSSGPRCRRYLAPQVYGRPLIPTLLDARAEAPGGPLLGLPFTPALLLRQAALPPSSPWGTLLTSKPFHCQCSTYSGCSSAQQISDPVTQVTAVQLCGMGMIIHVFLRRVTRFRSAACTWQRWESN